MIPEVQNQSSPGLTPLVAGIIQDAQELIRQQLSMFQTEIKNDLGRAKEVAIPFGVGMVVSFLAGIILCMALAHFLTWLFPQLPLFAAYAIVAVLLGGVGGGMVLMGKTKMDSFNPLPEKSVEALKENVQWTKKM